ncbi:ankyrin repeat-containing protein ITN1-like [Humulus lupulus]|uniref:ankyrin repeat-containing protein ITN1-like n=1 Tax=Humulus lupulus TaxID=3486 RepID=UPI002B40BD46|nr:ankyrin repeat-containing protein ITN1-like [Humulus lupulus]
MAGLVELLTSILMPPEEQLFRFIQGITNPFFGRFDGEHLLDIDNLDPLHITCGQENNVFHVAVKCGANPQAVPVQALLRLHSLLAYQPNNKGDTPLHVAARLGNKSFAVVLIDHARALAPAPAAPGHNNDYRSLLRKVNYEKENTALHEAVLNGYLEIAKRLIEEDPTLTCFVNKAGESPLFLAVDGGFYDIASIILDTTFPICSLLGRNGMTVMHAAVIRSSRPDRLVLSVNIANIITIIRDNDFPSFLGFVKKALERCGSQILEKADKFGWMPHHYAANMGQSRLVKLFLEAKRSVAYIKDKQGMTALHISARNGHIRVIRTLMEECPDIGEMLDNRDRTALHIAVENKQVSVVNIFLNKRAFIDLINEQDNEGNTALHVAAIHGYYEIIIRLASNRKTNKRIINKMGLTAFDIIGRSTLLGPVEKAMIRLKMNKEGPLLSLQEAAVVKKTRKSDKTSEETMSKMTQSQPKEENNNDQDVKHMADINLVVSTLIASITFQAAISMPGAGKYSSSSGFEAFKFFMAFDSLAFGCSAASMLIHFAVAVYSKLRGKACKYPIELTMILTLVSITSSVLAFIMGTKALLYEKKSELSISGTTNHKIWDFDFPGNIAIVAFFATLFYVFLPLLMTILNCLLILVPDDGLPIFLVATKYVLLKILRIFFK